MDDAGKSLARNDLSCKESLQIAHAIPLTTTRPIAGTIRTA
jgi:hypothetical protein